MLERLAALPHNIDAVLCRGQRIQQFGTSQLFCGLNSVDFTSRYGANISRVFLSAITGLSGKKIYTLFTQLDGMLTKAKHNNTSFSRYNKRNMEKK